MVDCQLYYSLVTSMWYYWVMSSLAQLTGELRKSTDVQDPEKMKRASGYVKKGNNGGYRPGSGRKAGEGAITHRIGRQMLRDFASEELLVTVTDPLSGKIRKEKKTRVLLAMEKLYEIGMADKGNQDALNKFLDRAVGKPVQPISGDDDEPPIRAEILGFGAVLTKVYGGDSTE